MALPGFLKRLIDNNEREIARYWKVVEQINALEPVYEKYTNEELRAKIDEFRQQVQEEYRKKRAAAEPSWRNLTDQQIREADRKIYDPILDEILPDVFAIVREASKRTLGMRHFDVQLIGGMVLHDGRIAEMKTGEGKTLVATLPLTLNALLGKGVHLVTVNDYLSRRDAVWNGPIYHLLGLSVGIIQGQSPETGEEGGSFLYDPDYDDPDPRYKYCRPITRAEAYLCDITYGTNNEFGFDYLRDNMAFSKEELRQRELHYAIVDEVDSILIDEARTPLIISGMVQQPTEMYYKIDSIVRKMNRGIDDPKRDKDNPNADKHNPNIHYVVDEKQKTATLTDAGVAFVERELGIKNLSEHHEIMHYLQAALKAHGVFRRDVDYVVKTINEEDGPEIIIVDENTGRLMFGRRYSDGLHQAIEAKEGVKVKSESQTLATITFQNYFRLYSKLAGMTGTAKTEEEEFRKVYGLDVVVVPTNRPMIRIDHPDVIYKTEEHKLRGIAAEILRVYCKQQPILVGTRSIEMSERVSQRISPSSLSILCMIEVAREALEKNKTIDAEKKRSYVALLNTPLPQLSMARLKPLLKELGINEDPLTPENMNTIARLFQIEDSGLERLEEALTHGIGHNILNAKYHEKEALIIAEAGRKGAVTIATNMAGRGVDILLGGKHIHQPLPTVDGSLRSLTQADKLADSEQPTETSEATEGEQSYRRYGKPAVLEAVTTGALTDEEHKRAADEVRALGGLFILGTERHESRRIDNQLRGRAGRQGDPGESRFYVSLEDELWRLFGDRFNSPLLRGWEEHLPMDAKVFSKLIERTQKKVEEHYFEIRKNTLNYDDVMNRQRDVIYKERRRILEGVDLKETILHYIRTNIEDAVYAYCSPEAPAQEWDIETLYNELNEYFMLYPEITEEQLRGKRQDEIIELIYNHVVGVYEAREKELAELQGDPNAMRQLERFLALRAINDRWMEHLANMDYLREGIGLRGYEQIDPLLIYQKEAFEEFERMQQAIQDDIVRNILRIQVVVEPQQPTFAPVVPIIPLPEELPKPKYSGITNIADNVTGSNGNLRATKDTPPPGWKGGRNDPCWCGSGLKYKKCHGKNA
ncbi:protein translocase subunit secA [Chthonomonas calidirosea]|uniref:Protein translocase subunit SecA n=1 Tax=Chthonomonas calidirosea (strain DSM 23976 / ICMP 18418 / T49) TaxID=1303518 RepID=S0ESI3_CHTCT|nr:preprotein translocase subunit SecA [Chthonomonas calidirosea]CCW34189.1 protein translocase subunit secA [Chthonomonas calidirosea T49]CEK15505.1 protein translocase subunit secA [Chthonomonas calidirosea]